MIYGIQTSQDVKLSASGRALNEPLALQKTTERFSRHLKAPGMAQVLNEQSVALAAARVRQETLMVIDPTDVRKTYAEHRPYLATVRDGSSGQLVPGYWACVAIACDPDKRRVSPLHQRLWSAEAPDFSSENEQLLQVIDTLRGPTQGRGMFVMDRGGDRLKLFKPLLDRKLRFIFRLVGDWNMVYRGRERTAAELGRDCALHFAESMIKADLETEKRFHLD